MGSHELDKKWMPKSPALFKMVNNSFILQWNELGGKKEFMLDYLLKIAKSNVFIVYLDARLLMVIMQNDTLKYKHRNNNLKKEKKEVDYLRCSINHKKNMISLNSL